MKGLLQDLPGPRRLLLAVLAVDLALLGFIRGADGQTPWVLWVILLVLGPALAELVGRWRSGALGAIATLPLLIGWLCVTNLASPFPVESLAQTGLLYHAVLLAIVASGPWPAGSRRFLLLLTSVFALLYGSWTGWILLRHGDAAGHARDVNNVALAAFVALMTLLGLLRTRQGAGRVPGAVAAGFVALLIAGVLESRAVLMILLTALALRVFVERERTVSLWFAAACGGVLLAALLHSLPVTSEPMESSRGARSEIDVIVGSRAPMLERSLELLPEAPVLGHGLLSFQYFFDAARDPSFRDRGTMVHNDYLQLGVELGWPALLVLALLAVLLLRVSFVEAAASWSARAEQDTRIAGWLALALLGVFAHALVNFPFYDGYVLAQFALLATFALRTVPPSLPRVGEAVARTLGVLGGVAALLLSLRMALLTAAVVVFLGRPLLPGMDPSVHAPARRLSVAEHLRAFDFLGGMPDFTLGRALSSAWAAGGRQDRALAEAARDAFGSAAKAEPWVSDYAIQHARMLRETGAELSEREAVLERALAWRQRDPLLYLALAVHRIHEGDVEGAVAVASGRWLPWCRHPPRVGAREHADLLALASLHERGDEELERCVQFLRSRGHEPSDASEVIARFTPR